MKTILILTIEHTKPLPDKTPITDIASQRIYGYLYANGVEASVRATRLTENDEKKYEWERVE